MVHFEDIWHYIEEYKEGKMLESTLEEYIATEIEKIKDEALTEAIANGIRSEKGA